MASIQYYDVILKPVVTEKSMNLMGEKKYTFLVHPEANKTMIKEAVDDERVSVDSYDGLTVNYAKAHGASHLIRGLRAVTDFEYEFQLAVANEFADNEIDMVFFMSRSETSYITSSMIMELYKNGVDVSTLVPNSVIKRLK